MLALRPQGLLRLAVGLSIALAAPPSKRGSRANKAGEMLKGPDMPEEPRGGPVVTESAAVSIGREDMLKVRTSLGRISDELASIISVLDRSLEALPPTPPESTAGAGVKVGDTHIPLPQAGRYGDPAGDVGATHVISELVFTVGEILLWACIFFLDIGVVTGMQLFLESIGRKRGNGVMSKQNVGGALASKTAGAGAIPTPSSASEHANGTRLSFLSEEDIMAAWLSEHWRKLAAGIIVAFACRMPQRLFHADGLVSSLFTNLAVMLRCMSLVMLLIRDDIALPKKERDKAKVEAAARAEEQRRNLDAAALAAAAAAQPTQTITPPTSPVRSR
mmetsp:Transcript_30193/g.55100  ORF Transcript_30193/g.55100 Transcript_30193/m.55100 type:complete len:333 (+) Transcript_30193:83-1081(+)